jgi:hypothetical protein
MKISISPLGKTSGESLSSRVDHIEDRLSNLKGKADVLEESDEEKNREG